MPIFFDGNGNAISIDLAAPPSTSLSVGKTPEAARKNIVHTATVADGTTTGYFQAGLRLKNAGAARSVTFEWAIDIDGTATEAQILVENTPGTVHQYVPDGGEQSFSDKLNIPAGEFVLWTNLKVDADDAKNATSRVLKIANLPDGVSLIRTGYHWYLALRENSLTYDEDASWFPYYNCRWNNTRYMAFGDSITQGVAPYYVSIVGQKLMCLSTTNNGAGGSSMTNLAEKIDTYDYVGMELITIAHGVNGNQSLGEIAARGSDFDINTFIGATQYVIETIQANSPKSRIVLITPIASGGPSVVNTEDTGRRKALHDVADFYGLACVSGTEIISDKNKARYLNSDALHPNADGQAHYGMELAKRLAALQ